MSTSATPESQNSRKDSHVFLKLLASLSVASIRAFLSLIVNITISFIFGIFLLLLPCIYLMVRFLELDLLKALIVAMHAALFGIFLPPVFVVFVALPIIAGLILLTCFLPVAFCLSAFDIFKNIFKGFSEGYQEAWVKPSTWYLKDFSSMTFLGSCKETENLDGLLHENSVNRF